jgi:hypothetical protein
LVDSQRCSDELSYRPQTANCTQAKRRPRFELGSIRSDLLQSAARRVRD